MTFVDRASEGPGGVLLESPWETSQFFIFSKEMCRIFPESRESANMSVLSSCLEFIQVLRALNKTTQAGMRPRLTPHCFPVGQAGAAMLHVTAAEASGFGVYSPSESSGYRERIYCTSLQGRQRGTLYLPFPGSSSEKGWSV